MLAVAAVAMAVAAYFVWSHYFAAPDETARYQFASVQRGSVEELVTATGTLQPRDYVDVGAQVSGQLERIHVEVGTEVEAGALLAEIDPTVLQSRVDATRAQLRVQQAQLAERESSLALSRLQLTRQRNLMAEDATSKEALQNAEAAVRSADAQLRALRAQIEQTESNLRADEANLAYTRIFAPISGTVVSIAARQGQTLNAVQQAPTILRVADLSTMTVQTQVSEADVTKLRVGMPAYFTTLGGQGKRWHGTLQKIEPTPVVQNNVVLYNALFDVPNPDGELMTQMTAQVFFVVAAAHDALLMPVSAITAAARAGEPERRTGGGAAGPSARRAAPETNGASTTIMVARPDGGFEPRAVATGVSNRIQIEVTSGLAEGERVVSGVLTDGAARRSAPR